MGHQLRRGHCAEAPRGERARPGQTAGPGWVSGDAAGSRARSCATRLLEPRVSPQVAKHEDRQTDEPIFNWPWRRAFGPGRAGPPAGVRLCFLLEHPSGCDVWAWDPPGKACRPGWAEAPAPLGSNVGGAAVLTFPALRVCPSGGGWAPSGHTHPDTEAVAWLWSSPPAV